MKRICRILILVIISLVCFTLPYYIFGEISDFKEEKLIENSLPTEQEIDDFNNLLSENTLYYYNQLDDFHNLFPSAELRSALPRRSQLSRWTSTAPLTVNAVSKESQSINIKAGSTVASSA